MYKKIVSMILALSVITTPCVALASHHHHPHDIRPRHHRRYHHRGHRSMHKGDYIAIAAGVIIGAILVSR